MSGLVLVKVSSPGTPLTPQAPCCNCGAPEGLEQLVCDLRLTRYFGFLGLEETVRLPLPFCVTCRPTASRRPPGRLGVALSAALVFLVVLLAFDAAHAVTGADYQPWVGFGVAGGLTALGLFMWRGLLRRPRGEQTSAYQPVRLVKIHQDFWGAFLGVSWGFTNPRYAEAFRAANGDGGAGG